MSSSDSGSCEGDLVCLCLGELPADDEEALEEEDEEEEEEDERDLALALFFHFESCWRRFLISSEGSGDLLRFLVSCSRFLEDSGKERRRHMHIESI